MENSQSKQPHTAGMHPHPHTHTDVMHRKSPNVIPITQSHPPLIHFDRFYLIYWYLICPESSPQVKQIINNKDVLCKETFNITMVTILLFQEITNRLIWTNFNYK